MLPACGSVPYPYPPVEVPSGPCILGPNKFKYNGTISVTKTGRVCQKWRENYPHLSRYYLKSNYNYCRNPDADKNGPWCYTTDPNKLYEYCDVGTPDDPICDASTAPTVAPTAPTVAPTVAPTISPTICALSEDLRNYNGEVKTTKVGLSCQLWSARIPHISQYLNDERHSFCRNPNNRTGGPWCYTTNNGAIWQYCDVGTSLSPICYD